MLRQLLLAMTLGAGLAVTLVMVSPRSAVAGHLNATVEGRVWESIGDPSRHYISARPAAGSWLTLGTVRLLLNAETEDGRYRYGSIALDIPGTDSTTVEVRVWQSIGEEREIRSPWTKQGILLPPPALGSASFPRPIRIKMAADAPAPTKTPPATSTHFIAHRAHLREAVGGDLRPAGCCDSAAVPESLLRIYAGNHHTSVDTGGRCTGHHWT